MNNAYRQGFIEKCAEHGIDPGQLVKTALSLKMAAKKTGKVTPKDLEDMFGEGPDFNPLSLLFG